jgi:2,4-dienoyl-CoA reductase-like NADH-dependent reductase (Old Yellow Enzyme family)
VSALFEPLVLRGQEFRNRLWVSPMCQYSAVDGVPQDWHVVHLGGLARGGYGLVMAEATAVSPDARITSADTGLWNETQRDAWSRIVDFAHGVGSAIGIQLSHAGRKAAIAVPWTDGPPDETWPALSVTSVPHPGFAEPRAASVADVEQVVDDFARSARLAVQAGFDAVELQAAHGFLLHSFLSPLTNTRDDRYGGSAAARARLLLDVVERVRAEIGDTPLFVRVSSSDWLPDGLDVADVAELAGALAHAGADLIDVSTAGLLPADVPHGPGYLVPAGAQIRATGAAAVGVVGFITSARQADEVVASGSADVVLVGRAALRDPQLGLRAAHELEVADRARAWVPQIVRGAW